MSRIVVVSFVSIDGVTQSPLSPDEDRDGGFEHGGWVASHGDDLVASFMQDVTTSAAGMLLGRRSYEIFSATWSVADDSEPAVAAMNRMPKYVVSSGGDRLDWTNSHHLDGDLPTAVQALRRRTEGNVVVFGGAALIRGLAEHDLVDEYRLLVFPVVLGAGKRLFADHGRHALFRLTDSTITPRGVALLSYARDRTAQSS